MQLLKKAKSFFLTTAQTVTPQSRTAVLSRTDQNTGAKNPIFARPEIPYETGLPSERFDARQAPSIGRVDRAGFGFKLEDR